MLYIRRVYGVFAVFMLLLVLAGCLTSYAAGPPQTELTETPTATIMSSSPTPTASPTKALGVTVAPKVAILAFQTITPTATATITPTATATPEPTTTATATQAASATPSPTPTNTPVPTNTPAPTAVPVTREPYHANAWMDTYFTAPGSIVTVTGRITRFGRPVEGANMGATFSFTNGEAYCSAYTNIQGLSSCSINIGPRLQGFWAFVDVVFVFRDQEVYAKTAFFVDP